MTRAEQVSHAVTALREARAATDSVSEPASMTFRIYEDNGGVHHWTLVADGGELLVHSAGFESYEQAKHAADVVHRGVFRASFEEHPDAERRLDDGGSVSSEGGTR